MRNPFRGWSSRGPAVRRLSTAGVAGVLLAGLGIVAGHDLGAQSQSTASGPVTDWRLSFADEFNGTALDTNKWGTCFPADRWTPDPCVLGGSTEASTSQSGRIEINNGTLKLWAERRNVTSSVTGQTYANVGAMVQGRRAMSAPNANPAVWETNPVLDEAAWTDVYMEARIKVPRGVGLWPAFWAMPADNRLGPWPYSGELDILEFLPDAPTANDGKIVQNLVWHGQFRGSECSYPGNGYFSMCPNRTGQAGPTPWTDFHTFGVSKNRAGVAFYIDGQEVRFVPRWTSSADDVYPFDQPFFPILRISVGAPPDYLTANPSTWPVQSPIPAAAMEVDYIRVFQRLATWSGSTGTTTPPVTSPPTVAPTTMAPTTVAPTGPCLSEGFESNVGSWTSWWSGSVATSAVAARTGGSGLAVSGSPSTAARIVVQNECAGRTATRMRMWVRAASPAVTQVFLKVVDRTTGAVPVANWTPISTTWKQIEVPLSVGSAGVLVGLDTSSSVSPGLFVDDVEYLP